MSQDFRNLIVQCVEDGRLDWETVAREFIMYSSNDDCEEVLSALTDNEY